MSKLLTQIHTFYYHFEDIYDLLEKVLVEVLSVNLESQQYQDEQLSEEALVKIFVAITTFQKSLSPRCHRGYEETIARIIREQLEIILYTMLLNQHGTEEKETLKLTAVLLSWGLYGASVEWRRKGTEIPPEAFIKGALPFIMRGVHLNGKPD